jgi:hypothetical protein
MEELPDPPEGLDDAAAKAALDQVHKRQDAQLAAKTSTETRALTLAGQCMTALVAVTGAGFLEATGQGRGSLLAAAVAGGFCLFLAVLNALRVVRPRDDLILPGRLPDEVWDELLAPDMKGPEFIARYIKSVQDGMLRNERAQAGRARGLRATVLCALLAVPMAIAAAAAFHYAGRYGLI